MAKKRDYQSYVPASSLSTMRVHRKKPLRPLLVVALAALALAALWRFAPELKPPSPDGRSAHGLDESSTSMSASRAPTAAEDGYALVSPTYLGGAERRYYGPGPAPERLELIWKLHIGSGLTARKSDSKLVTWSGTGWTGQPTLIEEDGHPYLLIGGYDHGLRKVDAKTGSVVWRAELDDVIKGTNTVYFDPGRPQGDRLVVVTGSRRGVDLDVGDPQIAPLRAFSYASGTELWRLPVPRTENYSQDVDASPLWLDGTLITAVEPGYVYSLAPGELTDSGFGFAQPAILASSPELYTPADVTARPDTGAANVALEGSPAVLGDRIYVASGSGHVYGLDRKTLQVEWDFNPGGDFDSTVCVTRDDMLLVGLEREYFEGHGGAYMLDPSMPADDCVVWFFPTADRGIGEWKGGVVGSVAVNDEYNAEANRPSLAAFNSVDGNLYVVSRSEFDGTALGPDGRTYPKPLLEFSRPLGGSISTPVFTDDAIITGGYDNTVHLYHLAYSAEGRVSIADESTYKTDGAIESTPLVYRGLVFIGSRDGYLYCLGSQ